VKTYKIVIKMVCTK